MMHYWWVNQNQTYDQEIRGGYMWSPKTNSNGGKNQFYENMKLVEAGDVVFSFRKQAISQLGVVRQRAISASKPEEFGSTGDYWANEGWLVDVKWNEVPQPLKPKDIFSEIQPHLPEKYSPLQRETGNGLQGVYLARVPDQMASVLLKHLKGVPLEDFVEDAQSATDEDLINEELEKKILKNIENDTSITETEKLELRKSRRGQGKFRKNLENIETGCRISGVTDSRLLIASHIKPWRACENNDERLDGNNGLLFTPTFDRLFDKGYITFDDDGTLIITDSISRDDLARCGLPLEGGFSVGSFSAEQQKYLDYHRYSVFLG